MKQLTIYERFGSLWLATFCNFFTAFYKFCLHNFPTLSTFPQLFCLISVTFPYFLFHNFTLFLCSTKAKVTKNNFSRSLVLLICIEFSSFFAFHCYFFDIEFSSFLLLIRCFFDIKFSPFPLLNRYFFDIDFYRIFQSQFLIAGALLFVVLRHLFCLIFSL